MEHIVINLDSPCLVECANLLVERHRHDSIVDLSGTIAILPGSRAGRRLLELLCEQAGSDGFVLVPPRIMTPGQFRDAFAGQLNETETATEFEELAAWMYALQKNTSLAHGLFPSGNEPSEDTDWFSLADTLRGVYRELAGEGISMGRITSISFEDESERHRWHILNGISQKYQAALAEQGLSDRYVSADTAIQHCKNFPESTSGIFSRVSALYVIGIIDIFGTFRNMLDILAERVVIVSHGKKEWFDAYGILRHDPAPDFDRVDEIIDRCSFCDTPADQAHRGIHIISELSGEYTSSDIILAVPDSEVIRPIQQMLDAAGIPCHDAVGRQFNQTELGSLAAVISEYVDSRTIESLLRLLRHPVAEQYLTKTAAGTGIDYEKILYALQDYASEYIIEYARGTDLQLLTEKDTAGTTDIIDSVHTLLKELDTPRDFREWPVIFNRLLELLYSAEGETPADRVPAYHHEAVTKWLDVCNQIRTSRILLTESNSAGTALRRILSLLSSDRIVPEPTVNAIDLVGWLELALDDVPAVIITGMNEGTVPQSITSHPFLPNSLRTALGLLNNERRLNRDRYILQTIIHSAKTCWFIAGRSSNSADPYMPSLLLFDMEPENQATVVTRFFGDEREIPVEFPGIVVSNGEIELEPPSDDNLFLPEPPGRFAVSEFRNYLACPYQYYLGKMKIRPAPVLQTEMDPMQFGTIIHRALEKFGESGLITSDKPERIADFLNKTIGKMIHGMYGKDPHPAVMMQAVSCRNRLAAFAAAQVAELEDGWRIERVEESFKQELDIEDVPVLIRGRIDRIDRRGDAFRLLDYKTGSSVKSPETAHYNKRTEEWLDLQLPLYAWFMMQSGTIGAGVPVAGYFAIPSKTNEVKPLVAEWDEEFIEKAFQKAIEIITRIQTGGEDTFKRTEDTRNCRNCDYRYVCQR
jgi:CRISPR/Cas system-associated exonuclease Cas4 (RecB family)